MKNERKARLSELLCRPKDRMRYDYDFGDVWEHEVVLEKIVPRESKMKYPAVLAGKRACPPEDIGGVWGYAHFLEAVSDPRHPDHEEMASGLAQGSIPKRSTSVRPTTPFTAAGRRHRIDTPNKHPAAVARSTARRGGR
jgi:hypothetical protein